jgi:Putative Flp pilus-assembly TadE/G-like
MMRIINLISQLGRSRDGVTAPLVALSLFGIVSAGALAFDYSRLVSLDTEIQDAADHAALAGVTQLDGKAGAQARALAAANGLIANETRFANDLGGTATSVASIAFYTNITKNPATGDADSRFLQVTMATRTARYALTPIIGALATGTVSARAMAGLGSAVCNTPPLMMCNPNESGGNLDFDANALSGVGIALVSVGGGGGGWAPGNFGYLDAGQSTGVGTPELRDALAKTNAALRCISSTGVNTSPGANTTVTDALNVRFDIYDNGYARNTCFGNPQCAPAANVFKDVIRRAPVSANSCVFGNNNNAWKLPNQPYDPDPITRVDTSIDAMGLPRDICHAVSIAGDCAYGRIGDANWERAEYFNLNHSGTPWATTSGLGPNVTRYQTYKWETATGALGPISAPGGFDNHGAPVCTTPGVTPGPTTADRRKVSAAIINCTVNSVNGNSTNVPVLKWVDFFLVEPSLNRSRTSAGDVYLEVIGETQNAGEGNQGQLVRRDVPYLVE